MTPAGSAAPNDEGTMSGSLDRISLQAALPRAVVVTARRPASWIAAAVAAALPAWAVCSQSPPAFWLILAVLACLAAVGDVPSGLLVPGARGGSGEVVIWTVARGLWPAAGLCACVLLAGRQAAGPATVAGAAIVAAAATFVAGRLCGAKAADTAALVIMLASLAAVASGVAPGAFVARSCAAGLVWLAAGGLAWALWLAHRRGGALPAWHDALPGRRDVELAPVDPLPSSGIVRGWLGRLAMLTALVGMAAWLVPESSGAADAPAAAAARWARAVSRMLPWAAATAGWFLALAVPQAILQDGVAGAADWSRLWRTGATAGGRPRLGAARFAAGVALMHAAVLGWPPLVAAVLSLPSAAASGPPLMIALGLLIGAGGVAAGMTCCAWRVMSRETLFALTLAVASVGVMAAWHWRPTAPSPISPSLPSLGWRGP